MKPNRISPIGYTTHSYPQNASQYQTRPVEETRLPDANNHRHHITGLLLVVTHCHGSMTTTSCHRTGRFGGFFMHAANVPYKTPWPVKVSSKLAINKRPLGHLHPHLSSRGDERRTETPGWKNEARRASSLSRSLFSLAEMAAPRPVTRLSIAKIALSSLRAPQSDFRLCAAQVSVFA